MKARELASELLQLKARDRERLLAELPSDRRVEMRDLIREAGLVAQGHERSFETHLRTAESVESPQADLNRLNDGQLRILLSSEQPLVQQHVIKALRNGAIDTWPPAVRRVVLAWLRAHQHSSSVAVPERPHSTSRWRRWAIWRRSA